MKIINTFDFITKKVNDLTVCEIVCLNALEYRLRFDTVNSIVRYFFTQGILLSSDMDYQLCSRVYHFSIELAETIIENIEYINYPVHDLACGIIAFARHLTKLEVWNFVFEESFKKYFFNFEKVYEFVKK
jgi:hypothetical protein